MRRIPTGLRLVCVSCGVLTLSVVLSTRLVAQTGSAKKEAPATDTAPLARYVPRENLFLYAEFAGLDSHKEAWRKTAAYKMLNETTLGVMLEEVGAQLADRMLKEVPDRRVTGSEVVKLLEHFAQSGLVLGAASVPDHPAKWTSFLVLRGAARKDVRPISSRLLLMFGGAAVKPELSKRASGRQIVVMKGAKPGVRWAWWAEKEDVVIALNGPESADVVAEVLDGKRPNAIEHPIRAELEKAEEGFEPVGLAFVDPNAWNVPESPLGPVFDQVRQSGVERLDYRWGLAGDALMTVARIKSKAPRKGLLALLDQPTFDKKSLLPMPEAVTAFTALSMNPAKVFDIASATAKSANPAAGEAIDKAVETLRTKTRLQLRKDILAHLGPKAIFYTVPTGPSSAAKPTMADAAAGGLNPLGLLLGTASLPKFVLMIEFDNREAFERALDALVIQVNKEIRAAVQEKAAAAAPADAGEAGEGPTRRRRPEPPSAPEFKMTPGQMKSYVLNIPSEFGKLPAGFRPTIRVGSKQVVFASSPELARQALEVKKDASWIAADEFATALEQVPDNLVYLHLDDPRDQMPKLLASLPGELQKRINSAALLNQAKPGAGGAVPGAPATSAAPASPGPGPGGMPLPAGPGPGGMPLPAGPGPGGMPLPRGGASSYRPDAMAGAPGAVAGAPGADGAAKPAETPFVLRIDPAKLPSEAALKALMFPDTSAAAVNDQEFRFVSRVAFPTLIAPDTLANKLVTAMLKPAVENAAAAAAANLGAQPGASPSTTTSPGGGAPAAPRPGAR